MGGKAVEVCHRTILGREAAGDGQHGQDETEAAQQHGERDHQVVVEGAAPKPANAEPLLPVPDVYA